MIINGMPEDYCVGCEFFDNNDCWVCSLPIKYDKVVKIVKNDNVVDLDKYRKGKNK